MKLTTPTKVQFVPGTSGYFVKDLAAVRTAPSYDPLVHNHILTPLTPGFSKVVQPGSVISILLHLPNNQIVVGDCVDVIFSGAANRDPLFIAEEHLPILEDVVRPWLLKADISVFRPNSEKVDGLWPEVQKEGKGNGKITTGRLHSALRYGLSQALLSATASVHALLPAEVIAREWRIDKHALAKQPIDILALCHRNDFLQLDRMIMKRIAILPHASFVHVSDLGPGGGALLEFVERVAKRIRETGAPGYEPKLHFDVYGTLGDLFPELSELVSFMNELKRAAEPFELLIESPVIETSREAQIARMADLRRALRAAAESDAQTPTPGVPVQIVADEWCNTLPDTQSFTDSGAVDYVQIKMPDLGGLHNTIDAVLYCRSKGVGCCRSKGVGCCLGGSANETDVSARLSAHVALATVPDFLLSKPGIGGDEGVMILGNEMGRGVAVLRDK
ncbi:putative methylaspartate ammonia-lyase [Aspergillus stella-maris]|uniref:putative methylaspartate ammonia-lyase n=1 Tax=Aspergillus stella-maris TaxID=1810926 RepID=UPI003CCC927F